MIAILILSWPKTLSAVPSVSNIDFKCLTTEQKQSIAICYDENFQCHQTLIEMAKVSEPKPTDWEIVIMSALGGILGGVVLQNQLHHGG